LNKNFSKDFVNDNRINEFETLLDTIIDFSSKIKVKGKPITDMTELYNLKNKYSADNLYEPPLK
jgi:hypothetical protein